MDIEKKRRRIALVAALNGGSMAVFAALCLLISLLSFSAEGILIGLALAASAYMELSGRRRLKRKRPEAGRWLSASQFLLLAAIVLYSGYHILLFSPQKIMGEINQTMTDMPPELRAQLTQVIDLKAVEDKVVMVFRVLYPALIAATVLYQGGLGLYYLLGARALDDAATEDSPGEPGKA